jgi:cytoskeletal protein RodZ
MSGTSSRRRHSPAVYRRRRLVLLLIVLLVVAGLVWLFAAQPWRSAAEQATERATSSPSATPTGTSTSAPTPTEPAAPEDAGGAPTEEPPAADACLPGDLTIEAVTDQQSYAAGQNPQLSIRLTNTGDTDCTLNVGTSAQSFTITSGTDVWWRSTDCQTEPSDMIVLLAAGQQTTSAAPLTWDRTRSSVDTCDGNRPAAPGGGATYHLSVAIGGIASANTAPFQLY